MTALEKAKFWLEQNIDHNSRREINELIKEGSDELEESFYKELEFGTGGLRGIMGIGSNRMNNYTVGMATQGFANYLKTIYRSEPISVAIAYDSRNNSHAFAQATASVFAGNGIEVFLFPELRPTPELSYAIRTLKCKAGVVITASHNPKEYNGYKAYWDDGAQLTEPHDKNVINEVAKITGFNQIKNSNGSALIKHIDDSLDQNYIDAIVNLALDRNVINQASDIKIAYSSIHGSGITMVPPTLEQLGFKNIHLVEEQAQPDGNFPTVVYPNPEEAEALSLGMKLAKSIDADILMATDPDADRVGIAIKNEDNEFILLNGNQMASLMVYYILKTRAKLGQLNKSQYIVKTIVTSELIDAMCANYKITCFNTLTGFKYISTIIREKEGEMEFIGGGEESYGFMTSAIVRDKDAIAACALLAEMTASAIVNGGSLYTMLTDMYLQFGVWYEEMKSITIKGKAGIEEINKMMKGFRASPPSKLGGSKVIKVLDYQKLLAFDCINHTSSKLAFPKSNVLQYITEDGYKISLRPSGTEPKVKFYFSLNQKINKKEEIKGVKLKLASVVSAMIKQLNLPL